MENEIPRRNRLDLMFREERMIYDLMQDVEEMPADTRLTDAVNLLSQAKNKIADFYDSEAGKVWAHGPIPKEFKK